MIIKHDWRPAFAFYHALLLAGYALMDKSFAYVGLGVIYVSEIGLVLGTLVFSIAWFRGSLDFSILKHASIVILGVFLIWSIICTLPYIHEYKLYTVRDALLWGYAAYAFLILLLVRRDWIERFIRWYGHAIPFLLIWWILAFFLHWFTSIKHNPFNPNFPILQLKSSDVSVHLAGIAAFTLLRLGDDMLEKRSVFSTWGIWFLWWANWLLYGIISRTAMLVPLLALFMLVIFSLRPSKKWGVPVLSWLAMIVVLVIANVHIKIPDPTRKVEVSANQIAINLASLMGNFGERSLANLGMEIVESVEPAKPTILRTETISWRVDWWQKIWADTVNGPYFWSGKGYGINLAVEHQISPDTSLRSPHNVFFTILARSGVPGLLLWCIFLSSVVVLLLKNAINGNQRTEKPYAIWFLVYFIAMTLNGSTDVYLEGPMGGIWFWSLIGGTYVYCLRKQSPLQRMA